MANSDITYNIDDFISQGSAESKFTYDNFLLKGKNPDTGEIIPVYNLLNDYYDELLEMSVIGVMSDLNYKRYQFRPRLLSYDLYGDSNLYFLILLLNNISSPKQFDIKKVRLIPKENISQILSYIYSNEEQNVINNRAKL